MRGCQVERATAVERVAVSRLQSEIAKQTQSARVEAVLALEARRDPLVGSLPGGDVGREVGAVHREVRLDRRGPLLLDERAPFDVRAAAEARLTRAGELAASRPIVEALIAAEHQRRERAA